MNPEITEEKSAKKSENFNLDDYSRRIFEMFDGEPTLVRLKCRNDFAKYIVDRFGGEIRILSPVKAVDEITEMAKKLVSRETV